MLENVLFFFFFTPKKDSQPIIGKHVFYLILLAVTLLHTKQNNIQKL